MLLNLYYIYTTYDPNLNNYNFKIIRKKLLFKTEYQFINIV